MLQLGYWLTLAVVFLRTSRVGDYFGYALVSMRVPFIVSVAALIALLVTGRVFTPLTSKIGGYIALLTFVIIFGVPFSVWPGGSVAALPQWLTVIFVFAMVGGFLTTAKGVRAGVFCFAAGCALACIYVVNFEDFRSGRLASSMSYGNPNDLAFLFVVGAPVLFYFLFRRGSGLLVRAYCLVGLGGMVVAFFLAGSRGAMFGFLGVFLFAVYRSSWRTRIICAISAAVIVVVGMAVTPSHLRARYTTLLKAEMQGPDPIAETSYDSESRKYDDTRLSAVESAGSRLHLARQALILTARHPVLGVGLGMYAPAENELAVEAGRSRGAWKGTHNMYLEVSAENGIPGLIVFLILLAQIWRTYNAASRVGDPVRSRLEGLPQLAVALQASFFGFLVSGLVSGDARDVWMPLYAGFALAIQNSIKLAEQQLERDRIEAEESASRDQDAEPSSAPQRDSHRPVRVPARPAAVAASRRVISGLSAPARGNY